MLKYTTAMVTFSEVPDEVSLCIELSNCPYHCPACHSKYLGRDIGEELTTMRLTQLIVDNQGITCVCFMGGDNDLDMLYNLFKYMSISHKDLRIAGYTGREDVPKDLPKIDYLKIGPYKEECGPINSKTTNQRIYQYSKLFSEVSVPGPSGRDITYKFGKNDSNS